MTALQNPIRVDVDPTANPARFCRQRSSGPALVDRHVHACLSQELCDILRLAGVSGSIVNVLATGNRQELRAALPTYLPPRSVLLPGLVCQISQDAGIPAKLISNLTGLYALLAFAASATTAHIAPLEPGRGARVIGNDTLVEAWQTAAVQGIAVLAEFTACVPPTVTDPDPAVIRITEVLRGVALGRWPCVRIDGAVIVPGWIERRNQQRRDVSIPAQLQANGDLQRIRVRDISAGGIGIEGDNTLRPGDKVSIKLDCGAQVPGVTMWSRDGRAGVKLDAHSQNSMALD